MTTLEAVTGTPSFGERGGCCIYPYISIYISPPWGEGGGVGTAGLAARCRDGGQSRSVDGGQPSLPVQGHSLAMHLATCLPKGFLSPA